jgi:hypothetical protein
VHLDHQGSDCGGTDEAQRCLDASSSARGVVLGASTIGRGGVSCARAGSLSATVNMIIGQNGKQFNNIRKLTSMLVHRRSPFRLG